VTPRPPGRYRRVRRDIRPQLALDETIDQVAWQASEEALLQRGFDVRFHPTQDDGMVRTRLARSGALLSPFTLAAVFAFVSPAAVSSVATFVAILGRSLGRINGRGG
jgi:hypothetical protein